ncbi:unnamed protein product [Oppiella nova]|uniref:Calcineurin-like phosphoesterase domain-containing protein n=1 Tax=Oppiella nova TaxID=334625 RepID=A0A7R9M3I0_9ACAR|nr:unnamed protein product [Oppiella nova]CAG2169972.1 unnamed protein product [Oppiella nova]
MSRKDFTTPYFCDIAYNLNSDGGSVGDDFMNRIQPIAANVPYQVCPGNHEKKRNFTHYINRFSMVDFATQRLNNHYYSVDMGSAHFVFFSSEHYFYPVKKSGDDLDLETNYGLEDLFYRYGVDIQVYAHKHLYVRSYPIYDLSPYKGTDVYTNPKAPIHIITGIAGTTNRPDSDIREILPDWVAFYARDYGYTRMNVQNKTHILIEQYSAENVSPKYLETNYGLEDLFYRYGVDIQVYAHKHLYVRSYPIYDASPYKGADVYTNPKAPIHIITGIAVKSG